MFVLLVVKHVVNLTVDSRHKEPTLKTLCYLAADKIAVALPIDKACMQSLYCVESAVKTLAARSHHPFRLNSTK